MYPYLKYGITAWGNQTKSIMRKLQIIQNKIIRLMDFKLLQIQDIGLYELEMAKFVHSFHHKRLPSVFNEYFKYLSLKHHQITRSISKKNLYLKRRRRIMG